MSTEQPPHRPLLHHVLAEQSGPRTRVLDEHMYRVADDRSTVTFRLQLFAGAAGLRPVAVATQCLQDRNSLTNRAETVVSRVWRDHFADESMPPVWVQRLVYDQEGEPDDGFGGWQMTIFDVRPDYQLAAPSWPRLAQHELDELVGGPVESDRGSGFIAPPPEPIRRARYRLVPMRQMPLERPFREDCMPPAPSSRLGRWWTRLIGRFRPVDSPARGCCWYHGGDWAGVVDTAARLVADVEASGVTDNDEFRSRVLTGARDEGMTGWPLQALHSLFQDPIVINDATDRWPATFTNGQHRTRAMRDAGVAAVLVETTEVITASA